MLLKSSRISKRPARACVRRGTRTYVVFAVLGLAQLFNQGLDRLGRGPHEAQASQVSHLLSFLVVQPAAVALAIARVTRGRGAVLGEIDLVVEEGGLRRRRRHNGHLCMVSCLHAVAWWSRQTHSLVVEQENLHLGRRRARRRIVPGRHHFGDVARDGLDDVHGGGLLFCVLFFRGAALLCHRGAECPGRRVAPSCMATRCVVASVSTATASSRQLLS